MQRDRDRILVVEDEESIRRGLRAYLEDDDFEVLLADSGERALEILSTMSACGAIVDIRLPGMDGAAFIEQAYRLRPQMKFVIYTGSVHYTLPPVLKEIGIHDNDVFRKPLRDMAVLAKAIRHCTKKREAS